MGMSMSQDGDFSETRMLGELEDNLFTAVDVVQSIAVKRNFASTGPPSDIDVHSGLKNLSTDVLFTGRCFTLSLGDYKELFPTDKTFLIDLFLADNEGGDSSLTVSYTVQAHEPDEFLLAGIQNLPEAAVPELKVASNFCLNKFSWRFF